MDAEEEWLTGRTLSTQPVERHVRSQVADVTSRADAAGRRQEVRIVVAAVPGQERPVIESDGISGNGIWFAVIDFVRAIRKTVPEMPFSENGRGVAGRLKDLLQLNGAAIVKRLPLSHPRDVAILPGENGRPAGRTDRIGAMAVCQPDTVFSQTVNMGRGVDSAAVCTDGVCSMVITHDKEYVWLHSLSFLLLSLCEPVIEWFRCSTHTEGITPFVTWPVEPIFYPHNTANWVDK